MGGFVRCGKNDAGACAEGTAHIGLRHGSLRPVHEGPDFSGLCWDAWSRVDLRGCREALRRMRWHAADSNGLRREMGEWPVLRTEGRRQKEKRSGNRSASHLVARSRFELLISALRGRRPKPLDERAKLIEAHMAGTERVELPLTEPESVVLPLDDVPIGVVLCVSMR